MSVIQPACQNLLEWSASLLLTAWTYLYMPHLWEIWLEFQINESDSESSRSENIKKHYIVPNRWSPASLAEHDESWCVRTGLGRLSPSRKGSRFTRRLCFVPSHGKHTFSILTLSAILWNWKPETKTKVFRAFWLSFLVNLLVDMPGICWHLTAFPWHFIRYYFSRNKGSSSASQPYSSSTTVSKPWRCSNFTKNMHKNWPSLRQSLYIHVRNMDCTAIVHTCTSLLWLAPTFASCQWLWSGMRVSGFRVQRGRILAQSQISFRDGKLNF